MSPNDGNRSPLVVMVGPTAVGKSDLAIRLASRLSGEIISADSRLFYRGMDIGTAKPSAEDRERVLHHLIDVADPDEIWSLSLFQSAVRRIIPEIYERGNIPFLVGGTGQYIFSITEGWTPPALEPDLTLRLILEQMAAKYGKEQLHEWLAMIDPLAAQAIDPSNVRRTIRALEVIFRTGVRFSSQKGKEPSIYNILIIGLKLPRDELNQRIDRRIDQMIQSGLVGEVHSLLDKGYSPDLPTMSAIGYREITAHILGKLSLEEAVVQIRRSTRQYVRRQRTWFKENDANIRWYDTGEVNTEEMIYQDLLAFLQIK